MKIFNNLKTLSDKFMQPASSINAKVKKAEIFQFKHLM